VREKVCGAVRLAGKLARRSSVNAVSPVTLPPAAADAVSNTKCLVDTGSTFSSIPHRSALPTRGLTLRSANGSRICCWSYCQHTIAFGGRTFQWKFLLTDVRFAILGVDFLCHFELVVDVGKEQLLPKAALVSPVGADQAVTSAACSLEWTSLLVEFPSVNQPFTVCSSPAHGVKLSIETVGRPVTAKFCCLEPQRLAAAKAEFKKMLDAGVVRRSNSC
jgi:hypothetical protein